MVVDQEYAHALDELREQTISMIQRQDGCMSRVVLTEAPPSVLEPPAQCECSTQPNNQIAAINTDAALANTLCGMFKLPADVKPSECSLVWVGSSSTALLRTLMSLPVCSNGMRMECAQYEPEFQRWSPSAHQNEEAARLLKRRYYLVQRAKDASIVGIIAGTLSVAGARDVLDRVRRLAEAAGKKTYTFLVGKPNPAKLGNFPEVRHAMPKLPTQRSQSDIKQLCAVCAQGRRFCHGRVSGYRTS